MPVKILRVSVQLFFEVSDQYYILVIHITRQNNFLSSLINKTFNYTSALKV